MCYLKCEENINLLMIFMSHSQNANFCMYGLGSLHRICLIIYLSIKFMISIFLAMFAMYNLIVATFL